MTDLEKHIRENRAQLDTEKVPGDAWKTISNRSGFRKRSNWPDIMKIAAGISIGLFVAFLLYKQDARIETLYSLSDIAPEYEQIENQYIESVNQLYDKIDVENLDTVEYQWLLDEITYLDEMNAQYRDDIDSYVDSEKLVKSLIDYYEKKIRLLERLELEINRSKNEEEKSTVM
jgi:uncharacterized protein YecA (UPF0149 family)